MVKNTVKRTPQLRRFLWCCDEFLIKKQHLLFILHNPTLIDGYLLSWIEKKPRKP